MASQKFTNFDVSVMQADMITVTMQPNKFASKELFKGFTRHLSHSLAQQSSPRGSVKEEAQNLIKQFFHGQAHCESEADWNSLCDPQT